MWDEDTFGLEYDLDVYNIVAVNDFNMGAMENKGLNVFNTALTLADPKSATDSDYERVSVCQIVHIMLRRESHEILTNPLH
jgi:aminopeptidase N